MTKSNKQRAIERLQRQLNLIDQNWEDGSSPKYERWCRDTVTVVRNTFRDNSHRIFEFWKIHGESTEFFGDPERKREKFQLGLVRMREFVESMVEEIKEFWNEEGQVLVSYVDQAVRSIHSKRVFVVHGHNVVHGHSEAARESVANFLRKLELEPVILHEQNNEGRTVIEKFEENSNVGFAVVLLTPDDMCGGSAGGSAESNETSSKFRARQNVILELGFFLGKLGRARVCSLVKGEVEIPSDYSGVINTSLDDGGGWKSRLIQELKAAGFEIDANLVYQV